MNARGVRKVVVVEVNAIKHTCCSETAHVSRHDR
jgi:hypothetical protein